MNLTERPILVGHKIQHTIADNYINRIVFDRQGFDFALVELNVAQARFRRVGTGLTLRIASA